jgi:hypothetical protein
MVEPTRRAAPLAIFRPNTPSVPSKLGAGTVLALPSGQVAGDLRFLAVDRRRRVALYELRIANETAGPLIGFAYPVEAGIGGTGVSWSSVRVPARTTIAVPVEISISPRRLILRVVAEIHGDGVHLTVDAEPPRKTARFQPRRIALSAILLLGVLGSGAYALEPRIAALARATNRPAATHPALTSARATKRPSAHAKPNLKITLDADTIEAGNPIVVRYQPATAVGTVKLLDQDGTERASALLGKRGSSIVLAPKVDVAQDFRLVVDARRGTNVDETALPVRIVPAAAPVIAKKPQAKPSEKQRGAALDASPIALATDSYRSGQAILISVARHAPNLEIALMDDSGTELRKVAVRPEDNVLRIEAPSVMDDARFVLVATFARGAGQDSVIKPIIVHPR